MSSLLTYKFNILFLAFYNYKLNFQDITGLTARTLMNVKVQTHARMAGHVITPKDHSLVNVRHTGLDVSVMLMSMNVLQDFVQMPQLVQILQEDFTVDVHMDLEDVIAQNQTNVHPQFPCVNTMAHV